MELIISCYNTVSTNLNFTLREQLIIVFKYYSNNGKKGYLAKCLVMDSLYSIFCDEV